jgi:ArsR family transcriptional regulator
MKKQPSEEDVSRYADMLAAMGTEPRLRIMRLLLSAHSNGMVVGEIADELQMPAPPCRTIWKSSRVTTSFS